MAVTITDPTLNFLHLQRESIVQGLLTEVERACTEWNDDMEKIQVLSRDVRCAYIQTDVDQLKSDREGLVKRYWVFRAKIDKFTLLVSEISSAITPAKELDPVDLQNLEAWNPEFYAQLKKTEEIRRQQCARLSENLAKITKFKDDAWKYLSENVSKPLTSFSRHVDFRIEKKGVKLEPASSASCPFV